MEKEKIIQELQKHDSAILKLRISWRKQKYFLNSSLLASIM